MFDLAERWAENNKSIDRNTVGKVLQNVSKITNNSVGLIELADDLDIETVAEIFIRVNSAGTELSQADFAMSKIAVNETFGGNQLRKAIDYFCHLTVAPEFFPKIEKGDQDFINSELWSKMKWVKRINDDIYSPNYIDMLRVAFTSEFGRGKLQDLVALLSGRNFETRNHEEAIVEESFGKLRTGIMAFMNETSFKRMTMILRSSGFMTSNLIRSKNAINFAYIIYLRGRSEDMPPHDLESLVRRWYVMSILKGRYTSSPETAFDYDIRQIEIHGIRTYLETVITNELPDSYWTGILPQLMDTSSSTSSYFVAYQAAQACLGDKGFLSTDITVRDLLLNRSDKHHVFPRKHLQGQDMKPARYNQIANFVITQSEINIAIGSKSPSTYFGEIVAQVSGGYKHYGGITDPEQLRENFSQNCLPDCLLDGEVPDYDDFLAKRRRLMALRIKKWFVGLS